MHGIRRHCATQRSLVGGRGLCSERGVLAVAQRVVTLLLLGFQLAVVAMGAMPEREACCCVSKGKVCKCKSHGARGHAKSTPASDDGRPCVSKQSPGCGLPSELSLPLLTWVTLPEPEAATAPTPLSWTLAWSARALQSREVADVRAPPPRAA